MSDPVAKSVRRSARLRGQSRTADPGASAGKHEPVADLEDREMPSKAPAGPSSARTVVQLDAEAESSFVPSVKQLESPSETREDELLLKQPVPDFREKEDKGVGFLGEDEPNEEDESAPVEDSGKQSVKEDLGIAIQNSETEITMPQGEESGESGEKPEASEDKLENTIGAIGDSPKGRKIRMRKKRSCVSKGVVQSEEGVEPEKAGAGEDAELEMAVPETFEKVLPEPVVSLSGSSPKNGGSTTDGSNPKTESATATPTIRSSPRKLSESSEDTKEVDEEEAGTANLEHTLNGIPKPEAAVFSDDSDRSHLSGTMSESSTFSFDDIGNIKPSADKDGVRKEEDSKCKTDDEEDGEEVNEQPKSADNGSSSKQAGNSVGVPPKDGKRNLERFHVTRSKAAVEKTLGEAARLLSRRSNSRLSVITIERISRDFGSPGNQTPCSSCSTVEPWDNMESENADDSEDTGLSEDTYDFDEDDSSYEDSDDTFCSEDGLVTGKDIEWEVTADDDDSMSENGTESTSGFEGVICKTDLNNNLDASRGSDAGSEGTASCADESSSGKSGKDVLACNSADEEERTDLEKSTSQTPVVVLDRVDFEDQEKTFKIKEEDIEVSDVDMVEEDEERETCDSACYLPTSASRGTQTACEEDIKSPKEEHVSDPLSSGCSGAEGKLDNEEDMDWEDTTYGDEAFGMDTKAALQPGPPPYETDVLSNWNASRGSDTEIDENLATFSSLGSMRSGENLYFPLELEEANLGMTGRESPVEAFDDGDRRRAEGEGIPVFDVDGEVKEELDVNDSLSIGREESVAEVCGKDVPESPEVLESAYLGTSLSIGREESVAEVCGKDVPESPEVLDSADLGTLTSIGREESVAEVCGKDVPESPEVLESADLGTSLSIGREESVEEVSGKDVPESPEVLESADLGTYTGSNYLEQEPVCSHPESTAEKRKASSPDREVKVRKSERLKKACNNPTKGLETVSLSNDIKRKRKRKTACGPRRGQARKPVAKRGKMRACRRRKTVVETKVERTQSKKRLSRNSTRGREPISREQTPPAESSVDNSPLPGPPGLETEAAPEMCRGCPAKRRDKSV